MSTKTIPLDRPVVWFGQQISEVKLREPTGGEFIEYGELGVLVHNPDRARYYVENPGVIKAYLDRCIDVENGSDFVRLLSLKDVKRIKEELFRFFFQSEEETTLSPDAIS